MLLIYNDVLDPVLCERLIREHDTNPHKRIAHVADQSFDDRVLFFQRMSADIQQQVAMIGLETSKVVGRHFQSTLYPETVSIVVWPPESAMAVHQDGQQAHTQNRSHAALIYLNDQENGGEIHFPDLGTSIRPRCGLLVAYDKHQRHGVLPVKRRRYTLTMWFTDRPECAVIREIANSC
jgi:hypothetical protein